MLVMGDQFPQNRTDQLSMRQWELRMENTADLGHFTRRTDLRVTCVRRDTQVTSCKFRSWVILESSQARECRPSGL